MAERKPIRNRATLCVEKFQLQVKCCQMNHLRIMYTTSACRRRNTFSIDFWSINTIQNWIIHMCHHRILGLQILSGMNSLLLFHIKHTF